MALEKNIFARTYPQNVNAVGDTLNLWVSSSQTGSGYYQKWVAKGITIPSFGANGDISEILEQVDRVGFKFKDHVDGLTRIDIVEDPQAETSAANSCLKSRVQAEQEAWWDSPYPHYASYVYDDDEGTGPFLGDGRWWFIPTGSALGGYSFKIDNSGKILAYCTCSSGGDGYPEMREPNSKNYFIADIGERLAYPQHYFLQFKRDIPIPKGPVAGAFDSSSALQSVVLYPGIAENFYFSDFNVTSNNTEDNRSSKIFLTVDRLGSDANPTNIAYITGNLAPNIRTNLPEDVFANIQDTNYETSAWSIPRYEGAKNKAKSGEIPSFSSVRKFSGSIYDSSATSQSIADENTFENRNVQSLYILRDLNPLDSYQGGGGASGSAQQYIVVTDTFVSSSGTSSTCSEKEWKRTKITLYNPSGTLATNNSGGNLTVTARYNQQLIDAGFNTFEQTISIANGQQEGSYLYAGIYQGLDLNGICREGANSFSRIIEEAAEGDDGRSYNIVTELLPPAAEDPPLDVGNNFILKDRKKGNGLDAVQSARILDIRNKIIYTTNSNGQIIRTKNL